jgi:hypothetical protein
MRAFDTRPTFGGIKPEVIESQGTTALLRVIVAFEHYARLAPLPEGAPAQSAGFTGHSDQVECPGRMHLPCGISRNRGLTNGYRHATDFGHYMKRDQEVEKK